MLDGVNVTLQCRERSAAWLVMHLVPLEDPTLLPMYRPPGAAGLVLQEPRGWVVML